MELEDEGNGYRVEDRKIHQGGNGWRNVNGNGGRPLVTRVEDEVEGEK